jgi:hypothetical protein
MSTIAPSFSLYSAWEIESSSVLVVSSVVSKKLCRLVGVGADAALQVDRLVVLVVALEPHDLAVALEGEDVRRDAVEEPAIVADDDGAAREVEQGLLERAQRVDVEVVGRLVEQQHVAAASAAWPGARGCARRPTASPTFFCWSLPRS